MCSFEWFCEIFGRRKEEFLEKWSLEYERQYWGLLSVKIIVEIVRAVLQILSTLGFGHAWASPIDEYSKKEKHHNFTIEWPSLWNLSKILG